MARQWRPSQDAVSAHSVERFGYSRCRSAREACDDRAYCINSVFLASMTLAIAPLADNPVI